jgi:hypothetical protein
MKLPISKLSQLTGLHRDTISKQSFFFSTFRSPPTPDPEAVNIGDFNVKGFLGLLQKFFHIYFIGPDVLCNGRDVMWEVFNLAAILRPDNPFASASRLR